MKDKFAKDKSWITPNLLEAISKDPEMMRAFADREMMTAINMMQTDPKKAMETYKNKPGFQDFLRKFMGLMGQHFEDISKTAKKPEEKPKVQEKKIQEVKKTKETPGSNQEVFKDPEVVVILSDPAVQGIIHHMQVTKQPLDLQAYSFFLSIDSPLEMRSRIGARNPMVAQKLFILIQKGVFNVERK